MLNRAEDGHQGSTETITLTTLDIYCEERGIEEIGLLKIDTEGFDLEVLKGGAEMLKHQRVSFIQTEAGMTRFNTKHVPFHDQQQVLAEMGYVLFGIYDQTP